MLFHRLLAWRGRKVRATQSTIFPNGKILARV
jgi:hypothetical protein